MTQITRETINTQSGDSVSAAVIQPGTLNTQAPVARDATNTQQAEYLIYFLFGLLEALLAFRLVLKVTGASMSSGFVSFIYGLTGIFVMPFEGIFRRAFNQGIETTSILEPSVIVAILVYALIAWGIVALVRISSGKEQTA